MFYVTLHNDSYRVETSFTRILNNLTKEQAERAVGLLKDLPISENMGNDILHSNNTDRIILCKFIIQISTEFNLSLQKLTDREGLDASKWKEAEDRILQYAAMKVEFPEENSK